MPRWQLRPGAVTTGRPLRFWTGNVRLDVQPTSGHRGKDAGRGVRPPGRCYGLAGATAASPGRRAGGGAALVAVWSPVIAAVRVE